MPDPIWGLSTRIVDAISSHDPVSATKAGIPGHDHLLPDFSPAGSAAYVSELESLRLEVAALPVSGDRFEQVARDIAAWHIDYLIDLHAGDEYLCYLNSIYSPYQMVREVLDLMDDRDALQNRLNVLGTSLAGHAETLGVGLDRGIVAARRQVEEVARQARAHGSEGGAIVRLGERHGLDPASALEGLDAFAGFLEREYLPGASERDAVGRDRYGWWSRRYLGMDIDLEEAYAWGWEEIASISSAMEVTAAEIDAGQPVGAVLDRLATDRALAVPSEAEFVELMLDRQRVAVDLLSGDVFDISDEIRTIDVRIAPYGGALGASYTQPSGDFSRPGIVWYSLLEGQEHFPLYDEISTAYHEGFPGHHLQEAVAMSLGDRLSSLHRLMVWYSGYGEGWALYAERLMHELGFLEAPAYVLGYLTSQMMRACRVVVDIGLHLELPIPDFAPIAGGEAWSFDIAVEYLRELARLAEPNARSEVTRYLGWPAQAISYKMGERTIVDLRERQQARQGDAFDLKAFHADVLGSGPVPLEWLDRLVQPAGA